MQYVHEKDSNQAAFNARDGQTNCGMPARLRDPR
jgi:hypothetical protein